MFSRVLVANRGEIAVRVIRARARARASRRSRSTRPPTRDALHVRLADRSVCIGPPSATDSYLRIPSVIAAARDDRLRRGPPRLRVPRREPVLRATPAPTTTSSSSAPPGRDGEPGDKAQAKAEMRAAGVPLVPGTEGTASLAEIQARGRRDRPSRCCLKATAGGGGKGMRLVTELGGPRGRLRRGGGGGGGRVR